jgi:hypothetical protein
MYDGGVHSRAASRRSPGPLLRRSRPLGESMKPNNSRSQVQAEEILQVKEDVNRFSEHVNLSRTSPISTGLIIYRRVRFIFTR